MAKEKLARGAVAVAAGALLGVVGTAGVLAQHDNRDGLPEPIRGAIVTIAGGEVINIAPGVIISGGTVTNETGIGVISSGGSSVGASTGGDTNATTDE